MQNSCIFTAIFITCWLPQGIFQFPFDLPSEMTDGVSLMYYLKAARDFSRQIVMLNTCLNPILLLLLSFDVREYLASCSVVWIFGCIYVCMFDKVCNHNHCHAIVLPSTLKGASLKQLLYASLDADMLAKVNYYNILSLCLFRRQKHLWN